VQIKSLDNEALGDAVVIAVANALTPGVRAYDVRVQIESAELRHGELVLVEVRTRDTRSAFSISGPAVRWDLEGPHVFVLKTAEPDAAFGYRAELRRIAVIGEEKGNVIATGNLKEGERLASQGAFKLSDGGLVKLAAAVSGQ